MAAAKAPLARCGRPSRRGCSCGQGSNCAGNETAGFDRPALVFEVVYSGSAGLPSDQQAIQPSQLYEWVRAHTPKSADAVFIGGNGFRSVEVIDALEPHLARPVTANQMAFWSALRLANARVAVRNYGRV